MKTFVKPIASTLLLALAPGCYRHGALLGAVVGTSIVTAAIVSSRPPPPARVVYVPPPQPGYVWQPGYWSREHDEWVWIEVAGLRATRDTTGNPRIGSKIPMAAGG